MKCAYCDSKVNDSKAVRDNGRIFCNNLCRYTFNREHHIASSTGFETSDTTNTVSQTNSKFQHGVFWASIIYFVFIYFLICVLTGAIAGGIAGAKYPANAAMAGANAGFVFVQQYKFFIMLLAFMITEHGILAKWLPFIKG